MVWGVGIGAVGDALGQVRELFVVCAMCQIVASRLLLLDCRFRIITFRLLLLDCHVQIVASRLLLSDCCFQIVAFRLSLSDCHFQRRSFWELLLYEPVIVRVCFPDMLFPIDAGISIILLGHGT